jgi:hypothetical protein
MHIGIHTAASRGTDARFHSGQRLAPVPTLRVHLNGIAASALAAATTRGKRWKDEEGRKRKDGERETEKRGERGHVGLFHYGES